ncbi:MAG: FliM/FliN family flagellar motor switch protein [Planctomycetes bacterium]|nr:FliM/FliN family flagellar motor switch protein [Planctomycetota bacterium]
MIESTPEFAADVVAACQAGAEEAAGALGRSLDGEFTLSVGEANNYSADAAPDGFDGAGLAVLLKFGDVGVAAVLPESSSMLPDWIATPDPTGESKLSTLAQELSMLLVPERLVADDFKAAHVTQLGDALTAAKVADGASLVPLELKSGEQTAQLSLIWPLASPDELYPAAAEVESPAAEAPAAEAASPAPSQPLDFSSLPAYSRSLLKIHVPVRVILASRKESLKDIVELAPGTIIKFDKACDELLHLHVGDQPVAEGEAVKVGDKFGFRVLAMLMPEEHFLKVQRTKAG